MRKSAILLILFAALFVGSGCSSTVYFTSNPKGAELKINGIRYGKTPCAVNLDWTTFKTFDVRLEKEGCRPHVSRLEGEPKWTYIIIDAFFLWPLLLFNSYGPKLSYNFNLLPVSGAPVAQPASPVAEPQEGGELPPLKPGEIRIYKDVADKPRMACLEFRKGNEEAGNYTTTVQEMFSTGFVESKRFSVIEREQIQKILKEKQFAKTDEVNAETARELGKVLGVEYLLIGSISKLDSTFEVDARLVDVSSGETGVASYGSCPTASGLRAAINSIVNDLNRKFSGE